MRRKQKKRWGVLVHLTWLLALGVAPAWGEGPALSLVPWPMTVETGVGYVEIAGGGRILAEAPGLAPLASVLADEIFLITTVRLGTGPVVDAGSSDIVLRLTNSVTGDEGYRLTVGPAGILIEGGTYRGVAWGTATLLQAIENEGVAPARVPYLTIADEPVARYRGLLIDVARQWHPVEKMRPLIEMCRLYKIKYLQLHLNDQQSTVFPFLAYPELASVVSGQHRTWTREEVVGLVKYADERGVTLVPELEGPSHHAGNLRSLWGRGTTLDVFNENTYSGLNILMGELCDVFASSPYIHIGGDEGSYGALGDSPEEQTYMAAKGITGNPLGHYITRIDQIVKAHGKQTVVWEGFGGTGGGSGVAPLPRDILVMPYESQYNTADKLVANGFSVINTAWRPLYVVGSKCWSAEFIYGWNLWLWQHHINLGLNIQLPVGATNVLGAQMCAWEQAADVELPSTRVRLHSMSERIWNPYAANTYSDFWVRAGKMDMVLDRLLALIDVQADGVSSQVVSGYSAYDVFQTNLIIRMRAPAIGNIHYTMDGTTPTVASPLYTGPLIMTRTNTHYEQLFYDKPSGNYGAQGYVINLMSQLFDVSGQPIGDLVTLKHYWYTGSEIAIRADGLSGEADGEAQKFLNPITVTLTASGPGVIRYTLNGGEPTAASPVYGGPLTLAASNCVVQGINWSRASARYLKFVPAVILRAHMFSDAGETLQGLTQKAVYWNTDPGLPQPDEVSPSTPTGLLAVAQSSSAVMISWSAATDNVAVVGYDVYRGGAKVGSTTGTSFTNTGLAASTLYIFTVKARDGAGNVSAASVSVSATTLSPADMVSPSTPTNLTAVVVSSSRVALSWSAATDNVGVVGYDVIRDGTPVAFVTGTSCMDTGLTAATRYTYSVGARDAAGHISPMCATASVTTLELDTEAPTPPLAVTATALSSGSILIQWQAATDNRLVIGYAVYRDGDLIQTMEGTNFTDAGLLASTFYLYTVKAVDGDANMSAVSQPAGATTLDPLPLWVGESFEYAAGASLGGLNGGLGWGSPWVVGYGSGYPASVEPGSLGSIRGVASSGNHLKFWAKGNSSVYENLDRGFQSVIADEGQTVWFAMVVAAYDAKNTATWSLAGLTADSAGSVAASLFELTGGSAPAHFKFGSFTLFTGDTNRTPHIILLKMAMSGDEGPETVTAYVVSDMSVFLDPSVWPCVTRTDLYANSGLMGFYYRGGRASTSGYAADVYMDEIRLASTWQAVVGQGGLVRADANDNSVPDVWEIAYFGSTTNAHGEADYDWDHDGLNNRQEYWAGTDPTNQDSVLVLMSAGMVGVAKWVLNWQSVTGKTYAIQVSTNLVDGFHDTSDTNLVATGGSMSRTVTVEQASGGFYRVGVKP